MKNKVNQNKVSASGEPNDPSAATSRKNLAPALGKEPASGELAAAPCSAYDDELSERDSENQQLANRLIDVINDPKIGTQILESDSTFRFQAKATEKLFGMLTSPLHPQPL